MTIAIESRDDGNVTILQIQGSIDGFTADSVMLAIAEHIRNGKHHLVADFSGVEYTSSAGLRALLGSLKEARQKGGDLRLAGVRPDVYRVLQLSGFTGILKTFDDASSAVRSYDS